MAIGIVIGTVFAFAMCRLHYLYRYHHKGHSVGLRNIINKSDLTKIAFIWENCMELA